MPTLQIGCDPAPPARPVRARAVGRHRSTIVLSTVPLASPPAGERLPPTGGGPKKFRKNLPRFTYETTAFQGWRLSLARGGHTFTR